MLWFRLFMVSIFFSLSGYTAITITSHGWNLIPVFFGDIEKMLLGAPRQGNSA